MKNMLLLGLALLLCAPAAGQELSRKYISQLGQDLGFDYASTRPAYGKRMDFDGDGKPDIVGLREDEEGHVTGIRIYNPREGQELLSLDHTTIKALFGDGDLKVLGAQDLGQGEQALLIYKPHDEDRAGKGGSSAFEHMDSLWYFKLPAKIIIGSFPPKLKSGAGKATKSEIKHLSNFAWLDLDDDGALDLVVHDDKKGVIEVWGLDSGATGV